MTKDFVVGTRCKAVGRILMATYNNSTGELITVGPHFITVISPVYLFCFIIYKWIDIHSCYFKIMHSSLFYNLLIQVNQYLFLLFPNHVEINHLPTKIVTKKNFLKWKIEKQMSTCVAMDCCQNLERCTLVNWKLVTVDVQVMCFTFRVTCVTYSILGQPTCCDNEFSLIWTSSIPLKDEAYTHACNSNYGHQLLRSEIDCT